MSPHNTFNKTIVDGIFTPIEYKYFSFLHHNKDNATVINIGSASDMHVSSQTRTESIHSYHVSVAKQTKYLGNITHTLTIEGAIASWVNSWTKYQYTKDNILITNGALTAPYLLFTNLDKSIIICPEQFYKRQLASFRTTGKQTVSLPVDAEGNFIIESLKNHLQKNPGDIAGLYINHNTGGYGSRWYYETIFELADIYNFLVFFDVDTIFVCHELKTDYISYKDLIAENTYSDRAVFLLNMSKEFNVPGIRVGFCLASPQLVYEWKVLQENMIFIMPKPSLDIAQQIIENANPIAAGEILGERMQKVIYILNTQKIEYIHPGQGINIYIKVPDLYKKSFPENPGIFFSYVAMMHGGVVFRPGSIHGSSLQDYVRCVVCQPIEKIEQAFDDLIGGDFFNPSQEQIDLYYQSFNKKVLS